MTLAEFNDLTEGEQAEIILHAGDVVGKRTKGIYNFVLHQLFSFYVEIKYPWGYYTTKGIKAFAPDSEHMELYIEQIDISAIHKDL